MLWVAEPSSRYLCSTGRALLYPSRAGRGEGSPRLQKGALGRAAVRRLWGFNSHFHLNEHTELAGATGGPGNPTIRRCDISSCILEALGRCTSCTGTCNPSGGCSQKRVQLTLASASSSVGAVRAIKDAWPRCPTWWWKGAAGLLTLQISLERVAVLQSLQRSDCGRRAQVAAFITAGLSFLPSTEALSSGNV